MENYLSDICDKLFEYLVFSFNSPPPCPPFTSKLVDVVPIIMSHCSDFLLFIDEFLFAVCLSLSRIQASTECILDALWTCEVANKHHYRVSCCLHFVILTSARSIFVALYITARIRVQLVTSCQCHFARSCIAM